MMTWIVLGTFVGADLIMERRIASGTPYRRSPWERIVRTEEEWTEEELKARFKKCPTCKKYGVFRYG